MRRLALTRRNQEKLQSVIRRLTGIASDIEDRDTMDKLCGITSSLIQMIMVDRVRANKEQPRS